MIEPHETGYNKKQIKRVLRERRTCAESYNKIYIDDDNDKSIILSNLLADTWRTTR